MIRTPDLPLRRRSLYPAELRKQLCAEIIVEITLGNVNSLKGKFVVQYPYYSTGRSVMKKYILMIVLAVCGIVGIIATLPIITKILVVVACIFGIFEVAQMSDESFKK